MTTYLAGLVVFGLMVAPPAWAAVAVRRRLLPGWVGAPARLVEALAWAAQLTAVPALLGSVGLFRRWWVVLGLVVVSAALATLTPQGADQAAPHHEPATRRHAVAAGVIGAALAGPWLVTMLQSWRFGTTSYDTLDYHLPFAARWLQTGNTWHIHQLTPGLVVPYHPASGEILNGLGMLAFHSDVVSPALNLFWLGLLALAGWCVGAPRGRAPQCMALALVVANCPLMISSQAGSAMTDVAVVAVSLAAVALVVQGLSMRQVALPLGVALGLAVGIKLDALPIAGVLLIGAVLLSAPKTKAQTAIRVLVPAVVIGGYWYVRDFAAVRSPLPGLKLGVFPQVKAPIDEIGGFSVLRYVTNVHVVHQYFMTGLRIDFGRLWPLWLAVSAVGALAVLVWSPTPGYRLAAVTSIVAVIAYAATPTSAFGALGAPTLFVYNVRYAMVGLVAGAALLPVVPRLQTPRAQDALLGLAAVLTVAALWSRQTWPIPPDLHSIGWRSLGLIVSAVAVVAVLAATVTPRPVLRAGGVAALGTALVLGAFVQTRWVRKQYLHVTRLSPALAWGRTLSHARIGFSGLGLSYPLNGANDSNYAQYIGVVAAHHEYKDITECATFRSAVNRGGYDYVVFSGDYAVGHVPQKDAWVRGAAGADLVLHTPFATAYHLTRPLDPAGCPT